MIGVPFSGTPVQNYVGAVHFFGTEGGNLDKATHCDFYRRTSLYIRNIFIIFAFEKWGKNSLIIYAPRRVLERSEELSCEIYNNYNGT